MRGIIFTVILSAFICSTINAQFKIGGKTINTSKVLQAAGDVAKAITLSDQDIAEMSKEYMVWMDKNNEIAGPETELGARLERLTKNIKVDGLDLNFKVYNVVDVNAFACGDGSVRVCAGLMKIMDDNEVLAVIGHEIGHVVHSDSKDAMKNAYLTSAAKNAVGSIEGTISKLSDSQLGELATALASAQYSQKQENEADDYGFEFSIKNGLDPYSMHDSLAKLLELDGGTSQSSVIRKLFSSHPETQKRVDRMKEKADEYVAKNK